MSSEPSPDGDERFTPEQVRLCLALIAHAGSHGEPARNAEALHRELGAWLARTEPVREHAIVWGPASFRTCWQPSAAALLVFVVHRPSTDDFCVVIRGGSPISPFSQQLDGFACLEQEPWVWMQDNTDGIAPAICGSVDRQLRVIRQLTPEEGLPGAGRTLCEFLGEQVEARSVDRRTPIHVTGHGMGGTLASVVALWLLDTQGHVPMREAAWDPQRRAKLHCTAFAGPSAGNPDFAGYIADRLGPELALIHNRLDHAPALWDTQTLLELPDLYQPHVQDTALIRALVDALAGEIERSGLEFEQPPALELDGTLALHLPPSYVAQAIYQHLHAYPALLGLAGLLDVDAILDRPSGTDGGPVAQ
ncbi:lipase family protein [Nannocystaceae bacterium ST9]